MKTDTEIHRNAGVWLDHRKAQIVGLTSPGEVSNVILSNVEKHPKHGGEASADDRRQRAVTGKLNIYYDAVIEALRDYDKVLVFGPGEAKGELHARLLKKKQGDRVSAIETEGDMTDRQVIAKVRAFFE